VPCDDLSSTSAGVVSACFQVVDAGLAARKPFGQGRFRGYPNPDAQSSICRLVRISTNRHATRANFRRISPKKFGVGGVHVRD